MTGVLEEPRLQASSIASDRLRSTMAAARLSFNWLRVDKRLTTNWHSSWPPQFRWTAMFNQP